MSDPTVVLIEDEDMVRTALEQWLRLSGFHVTAASDADGGLERVEDLRPDVVLSDVRLVGRTGLDVLAEVRRRAPASEVILITGHGDVPMAVEAMRAGAFDFLQKPYVPEQLVKTLNKAVAQSRLRRRIADLERQLANGHTALAERLIGSSRPIEDVRRAVLALADVAADVIVLGETGTGKEVVARCLHDFSQRAKGPFVAVNCAAIPGELIESELFGHEAGAFTGARGQRIGKFEFANGGTLLLDEIESMPTLAQAKVLRAIQERAIERVGSNRQVPLDLRIVAASKLDLRVESEAGRFRADLFYRLDTATIRLPSLRERGEDVVDLFAHFLGQAAQRFNRPAPALHPADIAALQAHNWPGNVRELKAAADRFALGLDIQGRKLGAPADERGSDPAGASLAERLAAFERQLIEAELQRHNRSIAAVVDSLQVPRRTLNEKMTRLGVRR